MSRIGNKPVALPKGVQVTLAGDVIKVKGPKGELAKPVPAAIKVSVDATTINVSRTGNTPEVRSRHGMLRAHIQNMVTGVTTGFERKIEINGVGYRADVKGSSITFALGYSHPIDFPLPKGVTAKVEKNLLTLTGHDRDALGQTCAKVRALRPPEPYKGKGLKYVEEHIKRKVGKTGAA